MSAPLPPRLRRRRPVAVPPPPLAPHNRDPIPLFAVRAAFRAHKADQHNGVVGYQCRTCRNYAVGLADAAEHSGEVFEVPWSAVNAYATLIRPTVGGIAHRPAELDGSTPAELDGSTPIDPDPRARHVPGIGRVVEPPITSPSPASPPPTTSSPSTPTTP